MPIAPEQYSSVDVLVAKARDLEAIPESNSIGVRGNCNQWRRRTGLGRNYSTGAWAQQYGVGGLGLGLTQVDIAAAVQGEEEECGGELFESGPSLLVFLLIIQGGGMDLSCYGERLLSSARFARSLDLPPPRPQPLPAREGNGYCCHSEGLGPPVGEAIFGKTILILGFGAIGMEIAKRLRPFGVKILATKRNWSSNTVSCDLDGLVDKKGGPEDMYELVREADIVITCMTLNNESVGIVDHKFLSALKKGSYLINIARGRLLDYTAVFNHLESGCW
ncbi:phenyllactate dehydrogenase-like [Triticum dicoccoides]|uniref:phenyllactate dehydrogenase-like n=1 Tax=Triticum dicoccoides TaxID=85692 RepID=UPI00188EF3E7|nr:phenyllactate dehydrogenase-like [Triticum dicoccoides]